MIFNIYNITRTKNKSEFNEQIAIKDITIWTSNVKIQFNVKVSNDNLITLCRILYGFGFIITEALYEQDNIDMTKEVNFVFESSIVLEKKFIEPLLIIFNEKNNVVVTSEKKEIKFFSIETKPIIQNTVLHPLLGMLIHIDEFGVRRFQNKQLYVYSISVNMKPTISGNINVLTNTVKHTFPIELINQKTIFQLDDDKKLEFHHKTPIGFIHEDEFISFDQMKFLSNKLPKNGWIVKRNSNVSGKNTILIINSSWTMSDTDKKFVTKNL